MNEQQRLYAIVLRIAAIRRGAVPENHGDQARAALMKNIQHADSPLAQRLHNSNMHKPYTISLLNGGVQARHFGEGDHADWRFTLMAEPAFEALLRRYLLDRTLPHVRIGAVEFAILMRLYPAPIRTADTRPSKRLQSDGTSRQSPSHAELRSISALRPPSAWGKSLKQRITASAPRLIHASCSAPCESDGRNSAALNRETSSMNGWGAVWKQNPSHWQRVRYGWSGEPFRHSRVWCDSTYTEETFDGALCFISSQI
jgi:hypothetical protein